MSKTVLSYDELAKNFFADMYESSKEELAVIEEESYKEAKLLYKQKPNEAKKILKAIVNEWELRKLLKDMYVWQRVAMAEKGVIRAQKEVSLCIEKSKGETH